MSTEALFVTPTRRGDRFEASIRGHMLELADPTDSRLAPNPDDLYVASVASECAWSAQTVLRAYGLPEEVSVFATWRTVEDLPHLTEINLTVTVSRRAEGITRALSAIFEHSLAARPFPATDVQIAFEGVNS